jgi:hypothetical protein
MDMVGRLKDDKLTVGGIGTASEWKNWLEYRNAQAGTLAIQHLQICLLRKYQWKRKPQAQVGVSLIKTPLFNLQLNEDGFGPSDHSSFTPKRFPCYFSLRERISIITNRLTSPRKSITKAC